MQSVDFKSLAADLLLQSRDILPEWLPGGKMRGKEYVVSGLKGGSGDSLSVNMDTGAWADFSADNIKGGDLISLYGAIKGVKNLEAAKMLGGRTVPTSNGHKRAEPSDIIPPPDDAPRPSLEHFIHGKPSLWWEYKSPDDKTLFYIARYDKKEGKAIVPWSWSKSKKEWVNKGYPAPRPLYGLDILARNLDRPVLLVEGEKSAVAARTIIGQHYNVLTWPFGSTSYNKCDLSPLYNRKVLIWPDADAPGIKAADGIAAVLAPHCQEVKIIDPAGQPDRWDAADALAEGWDWDKLLAWAKPRAKVYTPPLEVEIVEDEFDGIEDPSPRVEVNVSINEDIGPISGSLQTEWEALGVALTQQGHPISNLDNVSRVLEGKPSLKGHVWYDTFHRAMFTTWGSEDPRPWKDSDTLKLTSLLQRQLGFRRTGDDIVYRGVQHYAFENKRNEPREWIESIKWDGSPRIDSFFAECLGTENDEYHTSASKNFWIGMMARIFNPGCIMRNVVVLEGRQLLGKSTALSIIGGKWYAESAESIMSKDFYISLAGKFLIEIAELDSFGKAEVTRVKQVVSCRSDRYRTPYGRVAEDHQRQCIFACTTNEAVYLKDSTGGTRFWPVKCGEIHNDEIAQHRGQLFSEALHRYRAGEDWYKMPKEATEQHQEDRRQSDDWEPIISAWLIGREHEFTTAEIAKECLSIDIGDLDPIKQRRINNALRVLGWEKKSVLRHGKRVKTWVSKDAGELDLVGA